MAIIYNETTGVFNLQTEHTTYQMKAGEFGFLLHLYYGRGWRTAQICRI